MVVVKLYHPLYLYPPLKLRLSIEHVVVLRIVFPFDLYWPSVLKVMYASQFRLLIY